MTGPLVSSLIAIETIINIGDNKTNNIIALQKKYQKQMFLILFYFVVYLDTKDEVIV